MIKGISLLFIIGIFIVSVLIYIRLGKKCKNNYEKYGHSNKKVGFDIYTQGLAGSWNASTANNCNNALQNGSGGYYCDQAVCSGGNICDPTVDGDICPPGSAVAIGSDSALGSQTLGSCSTPLLSENVGTGTMGSLCCQNSDCVQNMPIATNNCSGSPCGNPNNLPLPSGVGICNN